jgi:hypothetical protein
MFAFKFNLYRYTAAKGVGGTGAGFDAAGTKSGHKGGWGGLETRDAKSAAVEAGAVHAESS